MRDHSVTIAKGIAIMLMVLGHAGCPSYLNTCLGMVRMPLFFFMSGFCFKENYLSDTTSYLKRRVTGIYWPYLKWALVFLLLHNLFFRLNIYNEFFEFYGKVLHPYNLSEIARRAVDICLKMKGHEQLLGGYWFLKTLFVGSLFFYLTRRMVNSTIAGMVLLISIAVVMSYTGWKIPFFIIGAKEFLGAFYLMAGHAYHSYQLQWHENKTFLAFTILLVCIGAIYWPASMLKLSYIKVLPYAITSICGTLALFRLGEWIRDKKDLAVTRLMIYTGGYTFNVLTWHFLSLKLVSLLLIALYGLPIKQLSEFPVIEEYAHQGWWILYFCVGVGIPILGTYGYHRLKESILCNTQ